MALPSTVCWEVRASGANDNNGGGFVAGGSGTDYSVQNAAQLTLTDLATTGVVTTLTSVTGGFTSAMVDNIIQIVSGTNFTAGFYRIVTFTNSNTVVLDRAPSTAAGAAGTGSVGGALATLGKVAGAYVNNNRIYATGAFTSTATITLAVSSTSSGTAPGPRLIGYGSTRTDGIHATLTLATNTGLTAISITGAAHTIENFDINCASLGTSTGISAGALNFTNIRNCKVSNFTTNGITLSGTNGCSIIDCEITGGTSAATSAATMAASYMIERCFIHDNACVGVTVASTGTINNSLIVNNSGASSDGISATYGGSFLNNTIHNNGRDGIRVAMATYTPGQWRNNILSSNGGFGINIASGGPQGADMAYDGNAYYSNTSGARNNMDSVTGIWAVSPYTNVRDVTLTASPYIGPTTGTTANFNLNNTVSAGRACKGKGSPGTWPGNTGTTGYLDMGAAQTRGTGRIEIIH